jgi:hypothetical protein
MTRAEIAQLADAVEKALPAGSKVVYSSDGYTLTAQVGDISTVVCSPPQPVPAVDAARIKTLAETIRTVNEVKQALGIVIAADMETVL